MGGLQWNAEEEEVLWSMIAPMAPPGHDQDCKMAKKDAAKKWAPLVDEMTGEMRKRLPPGKQLRRAYGHTSIYEHYFQNYHKEQYSPQAAKPIKGYIKFLIALKGGEVSPKHQKMLKELNRRLRQQGQSVSDDEDNGQDDVRPKAAAAVEDFNRPLTPPPNAPVKKQKGKDKQDAVVSDARDAGNVDKRDKRNVRQKAHDKLHPGAFARGRVPARIGKHNLPLPSFQELSANIEAYTGRDYKKDFGRAVAAPDQPGGFFSNPGMPQMGYGGFQGPNMGFHQMNANAFGHNNNNPAYSVHPGPYQPVPYQPGPYAYPHYTDPNLLSASNHPEYVLPFPGHNAMPGEMPQQPHAGPPVGPRFAEDHSANRDPFRRPAFGQQYNPGALHPAYDGQPRPASRLDPASGSVQQARGPARADSPINGLDEECVHPEGSGA